VAGEGDEKFLSFGQDVPDEIKNLVNFSSLNLQGQFDSPFLLALSGGEVARYLNKVVHLDVIDKSLYSIGSTLRKEQADIEQAYKWKDEVEEKIKRLCWLDEVEGCLVKLEMVDNVLKCKEQNLFELETTIDNIKWLDEEIEKISELTEHEKKVDKLIIHSQMIKSNSNKIKKLSGMISNVNAIEESMERLAHKIKLWQRQFNKLMPDICPLCGGEVK
jgi:DNA repair exonuclease SbcCD ATPase subunit